MAGRVPANHTILLTAAETLRARRLLFTDLANPTSNALYQRLGFRPASDRVQLLFTPAR
ncbi:MAG TPA: hypothetical protein VMV17_17905 [Streptosporangiaceae bacterium]|nr:hypothetical protein [Streptosporangiaceae bacterium]